jgi:hypothetical protein
MDTKTTISRLLEAKDKRDELERLLTLYKKVDDFIEATPTIWDKFNQKLNPSPKEEEDKLYHDLNFSRVDIPDCDLKITVPCDEILLSLRDYYERKIIELTEQQEHTHTTPK